MLKYIILFINLLIFNITYSQSSIKGYIIDSLNNDKIIDAKIYIENSNQGTLSDTNGFYQLNNISYQSFILVIKADGYYNKDIKIIKQDSSLILNIYLKLMETKINDVVIEGKSIKNNESSIINLQKQSAISIDGLSISQITKNNDNNITSALSRISGLTIENNKYVNIRGLGDRYNKVLLNGGEITGLDPNKNAIQLDIFPSIILDNIIVYKSFSPDLPGNFTGGLVDINTKDYPEKLLFNAKFSLSYNNLSTFNSKYLLYQRSNTDWLGYDNNRNEPLELINQKLQTASPNYINNQVNNLNDKIVKKFGGEMSPSIQPNFFNHSFSFNLGNSYQINNKQFGFISALTYRRNYNFYDNGINALYYSLGTSSKSLIDNYNLIETKGNDNVLISGLLNFTYNISKNNLISLVYNHNHMGDATAIYQKGSLNGEGTQFYRENRILLYQFRNINTIQLKDEQKINKLNSIIEFIGTINFTYQNEPDLRFMTNDYIINDSSISYIIDRSRYFSPIRYYRHFNENCYDFKLNWKINFDKINIKFGSSLTYKERNPFSEKRYDYYGDGLRNYNGNPNDLFSKLGVINNQWNLYLIDNSEKRNNYNSYEYISAYYIMMNYNISNSLNIMSGIRLENTYIYLITLDEMIKPAIINTNDLLPSINIVYKPIEKLNIKLNYNKTLARPV